LRPDPWLTSALAFDRNYTAGGEHGLLQRLRGGVDPEGENHMVNNNNGTRLRDLDLAPRGSDQEPNGPPNAETCANFVRMLLAGLRASDAANGGESDEHGELMQALAEIIRSEHANGGEDQMTTAPSSAPPPRYNGRIADRRGRNGRAHDRALAQDSAGVVQSLNARSFARRHPGAATVRLSPPFSPRQIVGY
jgi:hypothetical protein